MAHAAGMPTRILTRADLDGLAPMTDIVEAVEGAFRAHAEGKTQMPPKVYLSLPEHSGDFRAMPSKMEGAAGIKWVSSHQKNPADFNLPAVMGVFVLSNPENAFPLAILDGTLLTALRTGASAGVASRHLAKEAPQVVGFVGCGVQARFLHAAHEAVYGQTFEVLCADHREVAAEGFAAELSAKGWKARAVSAEEAAGAAIVNTTTPGRSLAVKDAWVKDGAHINAIGADAPGKQELESALVKRAKVVIDETHQASHSGEINVPLHDGVITATDLAGTIGQVIVGAAKVDRSALTVFDSTGLAVQDLALAKLLYDLAEKKGVGTSVDLIGAG